MFLSPGVMPLCLTWAQFVYFFHSTIKQGSAFSFSWRRLIDEPTNRRVSRMMVKSSRVAITRIRAFEAGMLMSASGLQVSLAARSSSRPKILKLFANPFADFRRTLAYTGGED